MPEDLNIVLNEDIPEAVEFIQEGAQRMDSLLSGLLRFVRLGYDKLEITQLDMNLIMAGIVKSMEFRIKRDNISVEIEPLPPCVGDKVQVNHVFTNIVENAVKYLDPSRQGVVHIYGNVKNSESVYCVQDNGIGILPGYEKEIFEIFHRLEPDKKDGHGLGLAIVKRILDRHDGKVWVESKPGKGSRFFVSLPAAKQVKFSDEEGKHSEESVDSDCRG